MDDRDSAPLADEGQPGAVPNDQPSGRAAAPGGDDAPARSERPPSDVPDEDAQRAPHEGQRGSQ